MAAIYQWFIGHEIVLSTTPYPVDLNDSITLSATVSAGWMALVPSDRFETAQNVIAGTYNQERWYLSDGPYVDYFETAQNIISGTYIQQRWYLTDGPYIDYFETAQNVISATHIPKLVLADTPDETLQMGNVINNTSVMELA